MLRGPEVKQLPEKLPGRSARGRPFGLASALPRGRALSAARRPPNVLFRSHSMKAYLITTGAIFGLLALAHLLRTIAEWSRLAQDPGFIIEGPGIGILAAGLGIWAVRLLRFPAPIAGSEHPSGS